MPGESPPGIANFSATIANPDKAIRFFGSFLGNPLARITRLPARDVAPWVGWTLAACFVLGSVLCFLRWKQKDEIARALPWLALGGTAMTVALMVALGRAEIAGVRSALTPRYNSMSLYLLLSVGLLGMILAGALVKRSSNRQVLFSIFAGAFMITQLQSWCYGIVRRSSASAPGRLDSCIAPDVLRGRRQCLQLQQGAGAPRVLQLEHAIAHREPVHRIRRFGGADVVCRRCQEDADASNGEEDYSHGIRNSDSRGYEVKQNIKH